MSRRTVALLALVASCAGASGCALTDDGEPLLRTGRTLDASTDVRPRTALFADTITARLLVAVDRRRLDPDDVPVQTVFAPFETVGEVKRERRDIGHETQLAYTYTLRCDDFLCLPRGGRLPFRFPPARVGPLRVQWPGIEVATRINESEFNAFRYRAVLTPLPEPTYRIAPATIAALTFGGAAVLLGVAGLIGFRAARRAWAKRPPELDLPPVERAIAMVRWTRDGEDRRRALELLAEALDDEARGDFARAARKLAWSDEPPAAAEAEELMRRVEEARRAAA